MCFSVRRRVGTFGGKLTKVGRIGKVRATLFCFSGRLAKVVGRPYNGAKASEIVPD